MARGDLNDRSARVASRWRFAWMQCIAPTEKHTAGGGGLSRLRCGRRALDELKAVRAPASAASREDVGPKGLWARRSPPANNASNQRRQARRLARSPSPTKPSRASGVFPLVVAAPPARISSGCGRVLRHDPDGISEASRVAGLRAAGPRDARIYQFLGRQTHGRRSQQ